MDQYFSHKKVSDLKVGDIVYLNGFRWFTLRVREFYPLSEQILLEHYPEFNLQKVLIDKRDIKQFPST